MAWLLFFFIWLIYPAAGTVVIIVLYCQNRKYKKRIRELEGQNGKTQRDHVPQPLKPLPLPQPQMLKAPPPVTKERPAQAKNPLAPYPGTAALLIGVVFVVLAGLIFATTAWKILPDAFKAIMVLAFSALFFTASYIAVKKLKIERTSRAFYILGSIFLFLSVLAVGYFKLLGPGFVLKGQNRWWVLWCGSIVTEGAFLAGFRMYKEKVYTYVCLFGLTVSMTFLMAALRRRGVTFAEGMVWYSFLLLLCDRFSQNREKWGGKGFLSEEISGVWSRFSIVQFLVFCACLLPGAVMGFPAKYVGWWLGEFEITFWKILCLAAAAAGMRLAADRRNGHEIFSVLYSVLLSFLSIYAAWSLPLSVKNCLMIAVVIQGVWFTVNWQKLNPFRVSSEEEVSTAALLVTTALLGQVVFWGGKTLEGYAAVTVSLLVLTGVAIQWKSRHPAARRTLPYLICGLTAAVCGIIGEMGAAVVRYDLALSAALAAIAVWDIRKKDCFRLDLVLLGTGMQLFIQAAYGRGISCFLILSAYLLIKSGEEEGFLRRLMRNGSSLYSLAGFYLLLYGQLQSRLLETLAVLGLLALEYAAAVSRNGEQKKNWYWDVTGSAVFAAFMVQYYGNNKAGTGWLVVCLAVFTALYCKVYVGRFHVAGLPMALMVLPLPWYLMMRGEFSCHQIYGGVLAVLLLSGIMLRLLGPIICWSEDGKLKKADWFLMGTGALIVTMAAFGSREWRFVYTLVLIPYLFQYAVIERIRKWVLTSMMAVVVTAWWIQPFVTVTDRISLEMQLFPFLLFAAGLPVVWGKGKNVRSIQTGIGIFCLAAMALTTIADGDVWDALILEGTCLTVFIASCLVKSRRWTRISGTVIVLAALYMTKGFWLRLSWWVYLLAAGAGLIGFAAWYEAKNREEQKK